MLRIHLLVATVLLLVDRLYAAVLPDHVELSPRVPYGLVRYASLGESFASGPSAGNPYDERRKCRRYDKAYAPQVKADDRLLGPGPELYFIACSGSKLAQIYEGIPGSPGGPKDKPKESQASQLKDKSLGLVTLSIGGNDVGFVDLLSRCVYRFNDLNGCGGCTPPGIFDDCTNDCNEAVQAVQTKIDSVEFSEGVTKAIQAVVSNSHNARLFVLGYPRFWNDTTTACDSVSFKVFCPRNIVLPLIRDRRSKMNRLTDNLNAKLKTIVDNWPTAAPIVFVDPNPLFDGHRFCEGGVSEPSYRNPKIWFYPFEFWTGGTLNMNTTASGDCKAIANNGGDQGEVWACELANAAIQNQTDVDLSQHSGNVDGAGTITSSDGLPDYLARIFHPTINGMSAYRDVIVQEYLIDSTSPDDEPPPDDSPSDPDTTSL